MGRALAPKIDIIITSQGSVSTTWRVRFHVAFINSRQQITDTRLLEVPNLKMASGLDEKSLGLAFQGRPDIQAAIRAAAGKSNRPKPRQ
jgi:hypothetical protein